MSIAWLEPYDIDSALDNWAAWYNNPLDINDPCNAVNVKWAVTVEALVHQPNLLHANEKLALQHEYLKVSVGKYHSAWHPASLHTAKEEIEKGLKSRKLLTTV